MVCERPPAAFGWRAKRARGSLTRRLSDNEPREQSRYAGLSSIFFPDASIVLIVNERTWTGRYGSELVPADLRPPFQAAANCSATDPTDTKPVAPAGMSSTTHTPSTPSPNSTIT